MTAQPAAPRIWTDTHRVRSYEIDAGGRLAVDTICNLFQEAASRHAQLLGVGVNELAQLRQFWVLSQLSLRIDTYPAWGERLAIQTWPSGQDRLFALRDFTLTTEAGAGVASGISAWLVVDARSRRPLRPEPVLAHLNPLTEKRADAPPPHKISPLCGDSAQKRFQTRYRDLDINQHMNNVRYIERVVESIPEGLLPRLNLATLQINFLAEARYGDGIVAHTRPQRQTALGYDHCLVRERDSRELARAQTTWTRI